jgi:hypothetical protein
MYIYCSPGIQGILSGVPEKAAKLNIQHDMFATEECTELGALIDVLPGHRISIRVVVAPASNLR